MFPLSYSLPTAHTCSNRGRALWLELHANHTWQALVTARFVVYSRHTYYKFRNSMVHMVLYNLTPASSRKRMHKVRECKFCGIVVSDKRKPVWKLLCSLDNTALHLFD